MGIWTAMSLVVSPFQWHIRSLRMSQEVVAVWTLALVGRRYRAFVGLYRSLW